MAPKFGEMAITVSPLTLEVHDRHVSLGNTPIAMGGAKMIVSGIYNFDGALDLDVRADLRDINRRWLNTGAEGEPAAHEIDMHMAGSFGKMAVVPEIATAQANPGRQTR